MSSQQISSPLPGTFYRRRAPDQPLLIEEGSAVAEGDVIGVIEIMKTFYEVKADRAGTAVRFLIENEGTVEAGEPLLEIQA